MLEKLKVIDVPVLLTYYKQGMSDNQIGKLMGFHGGSIGHQRRKLGLIPNRRVKAQLRLIGDSHAICSKCGETKDLSHFIVNRRGGPYTYSLSYCNECRKRDNVISINANIARYMVMVCSRLRTRCRNGRLPFDLTTRDLVELFESQKGLCFYTDTPLAWGAGQGPRRNALSVDRIIHNEGYTKNNVVLCTYRVNTIKSDLSIEELEKWMPSWHERILSLSRSGNAKSVKSL